MNHQTISHISWIPAADLHQANLLPYYYAPVFRQMDAILGASGDNYEKLGKYIQPVLKKEIDKADISRERVKWIIRCQEDLIEAVRLEDAEILFAPVLVPDNTMVVGSVPGSRFQPALYWDQKLFRGSAITSIHNLIYTARGSHPIAWVQKALTDEQVVKQIQRQSIGTGTIFSRLVPGALPGVKVLKKSKEELLRLSNQVVHDLKQRLAINRKHLRIAGEEFNETVLIPGATFREKLDHFEKLLEQRFSEECPIFFVEAATENPDSDLFSVTQLFVKGADDIIKSTFVKPSPDPDLEAGREWRKWYWSDRNRELYGVFNSFEGGKVLPDYLLTRLAQNPALKYGQKGQPVHLLSFQTVKNIIEANQGETLGKDQLDHDLQTAWRSVNKQPIRSDALKEWVDLVYRPVLIIKIIKSKKAAGAYFICGRSQLTDALFPFTELNHVGEQLSQSLYRAIDIGDEILRSESLRRLSWIMHQISGPAMRLRNGLEDMNSFVKRNSEIGAMLLPDELSAAKRARMRGVDLKEFTFANRLESLNAAVTELERLRYQVRRFKNAHRELDLSDVQISILFGKLEETARAHLPELEVLKDVPDDLSWRMDFEMIVTALAEVVQNACREFKTRETKSPNLVMKAERLERNLVIRITDNALPEHFELPPDVFEEDASTYARTNQGTGLGLAIVRVTFVRHGGRCRLDHNYAADATRLPGVMFSGEIPFMEGDAGNV